MPITPSPRQANGHGISFSEALTVWGKIALLSFGGPASQISLMHRLLVEEKNWISEQRFMHALNYCMLLPGPEAQQLSIYLGWLLHRTRGGIIAGVLFILPGFFAILGLSIIYALYQDMPPVEALFFGLKPAVLAIVLHAARHIGRRALTNRMMVILSGCAFIAIFFFHIPFPAIIFSAALIGWIGGTFAPKFFPLKSHEKHRAARAALDQAIDNGYLMQKIPGAARNIRIISFFLLFWFAPLFILAGTMGVSNLFVQQGIFFSKMAVVTFGGAYAVLSYVAQQAVNHYGWLLPGEMLDGLGMAETTPGPLIQVVQFVGFMGAYRYPGPLDPLTAGIMASLLVTWVTFVPCFLWIFLGAPYVEKLRENAHLTHALSAITAAVVGVILNLALWFSLHVIFHELKESHVYGMKLDLPVWSSIDLASLALASGAMVAMFCFRTGMLSTIMGCIVLGGAYRLLF